VNTAPAGTPEPEPGPESTQEPAAATDADPATGPESAQEPMSAADSDPAPATGPESAQEPMSAADSDPAPATGPESAKEPESAAGSGADAEDGTHRGRAPLLLGAAAAVLVAFAVWAGFQAHSLRAQTAAQNVALTDRPTTLALTRQITSAIDTVFSYDYADTAKTSTAAQALLTGQAIRQYNSLFRLVQREAPTQRLVLTTTVTNAGVELLTGDRARVLVFANQRDTRGTTHQTSYAGAMFAVNAVRQAGRWRIDNIDTFTAGS
jgi:Mce-associated membrane protein